MNLTVDLTGKFALVGGATSGIGMAIAQKLAEHGCTVTLIGRSEEKCQKCLVKLDKTGGQKHDYICADVADLINLKHEVELLLQKKKLDIWINNVGGPDAGAILDTPVTYMEDVFRSHLLSSQILLQTLAENFKKIQYGRIVNVLGTSLISHVTYLAPSSVRSAMLNWSKHVAMELGSSGVTVNNIMPGPVNTPELSRLVKQIAKIKNSNPSDVLKAIQDDMIIKRIAEPDEVASIVLFMVSDYFGNATGSTLIVDGGMSKHVGM